MTKCEVISFDPSMGWTDKQRPNGRWFYNMGLGGEKNDNYQGVGMGQNKASKWIMDTVEGFMKTHKHERLDILKIDIEYGEWAALRQAINAKTLDNVDQLLFEVHFWHGEVLDNVKAWASVIQDLDLFGYKLFYYHTNPLSTSTNFKLGMTIPCCFELGYIKINK